MGILRVTWLRTSTQTHAHTYIHSDREVQRSVDIYQTRSAADQFVLSVMMAVIAVILCPCLFYG